jgi:hypothetical protein
MRVERKEVQYFADGWVTSVDRKLTGVDRELTDVDRELTGRHRSTYHCGRHL